MEFDGTFSLTDVTPEEVWLALSDPVMVKNALPGCQFLVEVDDPDDVDWDELEAQAGGDDPETLPEADPETVADRALEEGGHYAALVQVGVGSVKPRFETVVTIDRKEFPEMDASGHGSAKDSSFEMDSGMELVETDDGVDVEWWTEADVFGKVAQMGQRVINPVANRVVGRFFKQIQSQLTDVGDESSGLTDRIRGLL
ncbi:MAG: CoxG family protein [Haloplanus sp.]